MDTNNNIFFTVEDKPDNDGTTKLTDIDKMMDELLNDGCDDEDLDFDYSFDYGFDYGFENIEKKTSSSSSSSSSTLAYFDEKKLYIGVPDSYYEAHTIKELMKICEYYDLAKNVKNAKCKKQDIVATIVFFEAQPENREIVNKRNKMWAYMREVANDQKMKPYLIWT
jgi:hypothetical protein